MDVWDIRPGCRHSQLASCLAVSLAVSTEVFWTCPRCVMVLLCRSFATFIRCTADMFQLQRPIGTRRTEDREPGGQPGGEEGGGAPEENLCRVCFRVIGQERPNEMLSVS